MVEISELQIGDQVQTGIGTELFRFVHYITLLFILETQTQTSDCKLKITAQLFALTLCMKSLKVFDFSLVSSTSGVKHSEVVAFLEMLPTMIIQFLCITTFDNKSLTLTGNHQLYAKQGFDDQFHPM